MLSHPRYVLDLDIPKPSYCLAYNESPHQNRIATVDVEEPHGSLIERVPAAEGADEKRVHLVALSPEVLRQSRVLLEFLRPGLIERNLAVLKRHGDVDDRDRSPR